MSICIEELTLFKLYNRPLYLPVNDDDRKNGSAIFLLSPNLNSSKSLIYPRKSIRGTNNFKSYYLERDISYYIHSESNTMEGVFDRLILENGELQPQLIEKNTLTEFDRIDISDKTIEEHMNDTDKLCGIVEYFPWKGYLYLDENEKVIAGINVNIEDREIQKIFVVDEKYNYLYKDLIKEARNMKANDIIINNDDTSVKYFKDFGFSESEKIDESKIRLSFRVNIEESAIDKDFEDLKAYVKKLYKPLKGKADQYTSDAANITSDVCVDLAKQYNLDKKIAYLIGYAIGFSHKFYGPLESDHILSITKNDSKLHAYMDKNRITICCMALKEVLSDKIENIYAKLLNDSIMLANHTFIKLIIHNEAEEFRSKNEGRLAIEDVGDLDDIIQNKYGKHTPNHFYLNTTYKIYRKNSRQLQDQINRGLSAEIVTYEKITYSESARVSGAERALTESHITFGYKDEIFEDTSASSVWKDYKKTIEETPTNESFSFKPVGKTKGIVIRGKEKVKGAITVDSTNRITEMDANEMIPDYLILVGVKKFGANKVIVPESCELLNKAFQRSKMWEMTHKTKSGYVYTSHEKKMPYDHIPLDEDTEFIYNHLSDKEKDYLGSQYKNEVCVTNTIYRKAIKEKAFIDLYMQPQFDGIASIDIAVLPRYRGKGYASMMVREAEDYCKKNLKELHTLQWTCESDNEASYNLAKHCGFVPYAESGGFRHLYKSLVKNRKIEKPIAEDTEVYHEPVISATTTNAFKSSINESGVLMLMQEEADEFISSRSYDNKFRKILWNDRIRTSKQILNIYDDIKKDNRLIKNAYTDLDRYKGLNIYVDLSYYNISFFNNYSKLKQSDPKKLADLYIDLMRRMINDSRFKDKYKRRTVFIPLEDWCGQVVKEDPTTKLDYKTNLNPVSTLLYYAKMKLVLLNKAFPGVDFVFMTDTGFFKANFGSMTKPDYVKFYNGCLNLIKKTIANADDGNIETPKAIVNIIADKFEKSKGIEIKNITGGTSKISKEELDEKIRSSDLRNMEDSEEKKAVLVNIVKKTAEASKNTEDAVKTLDKEDTEANNFVKNLIDTIESDEDNNVKITAARSKRMKTLSDEFLKDKIDGRTIESILDDNKDEEELPETKVPIDSINEDWDKLKFVNFEKKYNMDSDIAKIMLFLSTRSAPIAVRDYNIEDTSTSEDWKYTYTYDLEDMNGKRFKFKFDIPKLKDNRFMKIGGNDKNISGQLVLLPISKTDTDTVQIVSNYNKIFVRRYGNGVGRSMISTDIFVKAIEEYAKNHPKTVKITYGDNSIVCNKYTLPYDYYDLATTYSKIEILGNSHNNVHLIFYFNQDEIRKLYKIDDTAGIPYAYNVTDKSILYFNAYKFETISGRLNGLCESFLKDFNSKKFKPSSKHMYSRASILATDIPVIVIMAFNEGLQTAMKKAKIVYRVSDKRDKNYGEEGIKFKDGYIYYQVGYTSSLLMNGLSEVDTENYSIVDMDKKSVWTESLDHFGGRIKADGLDNFYDLMIDPITKEVCEKYKLPTDYVTMLAYANILLADSEYTDHTDLSSNRYRTNELIAAYAYKCISYAYADYKNQLKRNRTGVVLSMKQSAIIDAIMADPTASDLSILNPLLEMEARNTVSYKGLVGMNSDRSYSLDKRTFSDSMLNHLAMSTGFAGNVGVNRQTTINMAIMGARGYIKNSNVKDCSTANTLSITEALTPYGTNHDDPFRTAMTFVQTSKHNMRIKKGMPLLVTNGADEALPYLTSDTFAFKAKGNGKVIKKNDKYMIVEYNSGRNSDGLSWSGGKHTEIIDLRENIKKNSDGGFYITVQLATSLKVGDKFKQNDILAYDPVVYSDEVGDSDTIGYNIGALANVAFINTDEGFEDSGIISHRLADCMSSEVVVKMEKDLPINTNIFSIAKKGQTVQEGDTILLFQSPFEDEDANALVKSLSMDKKEVSELGRIPIRSKVTGIVQDIKFYRTNELSEMSSSLKKAIKEYESEISEIRSAKEKSKASNDIDLDADYKLPATGQLKNCDGKVKVVFYLKYNDRMGIGDKLVFMSALKGETKDIFPIGKEPYTDRVPNEMIDTMCPLDSVARRMVASVKNLSALYKFIVELNRQCKEELGLKYIPYNKKD